VHSINEQWNDSETECQCDQYEFVTTTEERKYTHVITLIAARSATYLARNL